MITRPDGFLAAGVECGIKTRGGLDLCLIVAEQAAPAAVLITRNRVKAAPCLLSQARVAAGPIRAVVANSGNANACTGPQGEATAQAMTRHAAEALGIPEAQVVVASTGVIGVQLPLEKARKGIVMAARQLSRDGGEAAARAIMTTDLVPKTATATLMQGAVSIGGMAKGSGMIHPDMATMLGFITTNASLPPDRLREALQTAVDASFHMITVDGDVSTNDMVLLMSGHGPEPPFDDFLAALTDVCQSLAKAIARDGEGAAHLIEVQVTGAASLEDARRASKAVVGSSLVKAAVFGGDANWGRILAALGYSGADFDPARATVDLGDVPVYRDGTGLVFDEVAAKAVLDAPEVIIRADLGAGSASATAWGCDLTYGYVEINGKYRT